MPLPFQRFNCIEEGCASPKFLRSTLKAIFFSIQDDYSPTLNVPLGFSLTPFANIGGKDSEMEFLDLKFFDLEEMKCKGRQCGALPGFLFEKDDKDYDKNGYYCKYCGKYNRFVHIYNVENYEHFQSLLGSCEARQFEEHQTIEKRFVFVLEIFDNFLEDFEVLVDYLIHILPEFCIELFEAKFCLLLVFRDMIYILDLNLASPNNIVNLPYKFPLRKFR